MGYLSYRVCWLGKRNRETEENVVVYWSHVVLFPIENDCCFASKTSCDEALKRLCL